MHLAVRASLFAQTSEMRSSLYVGFISVSSYCFAAIQDTSVSCYSPLARIRHYPSEIVLKGGGALIRENMVVKIPQGYV